MPAVSLFGGKTIAALAATVLAPAATAAVVISADDKFPAYQNLQQNLSGIPYETPDCGHHAFGEHITQAFDRALQREVFLFHLHRDEDDDRCLLHDRQRVEIKAHAKSPERLLGRKGEQATYQWMFRLDERFRPSPHWSHLFQIKPVGKGAGSNPLFTFSAQALPEGEVFQLRHDSGDGQGLKVLYEHPLSELKGEWIQATVTVLHSTSGRLAVSLIRVTDRRYLFEWKDTQINMFRNGTEFNRPKWGHYRSLVDSERLRNEIVRFADFCITENNDCPDLLPTPRRHVERLYIDPFPTGRLGGDFALLQLFRQLFQRTKAGPAPEAAAKTDFQPVSSKPVFRFSAPGPDTVEQ